MCIRDSFCDVLGDPNDLRAVFRWVETKDIISYVTLSGVGDIVAGKSAQCVPVGKLFIYLCNGLRIAALRSHQLIPIIIPFKLQIGITDDTFNIRGAIRCV